VNEHFIIAPGAAVMTRRFPLLRARIETICGGVVPVASPTCIATAVYPPLFDVTIRPVFPSAVVNWFPVIVSVVSPVRPAASQLKVPV
jgi:hypothetical protein